MTEGWVWHLLEAASAYIVNWVSVISMSMLKPPLSQTRFGMNQVKESKQAARVPEVPRVPIHPRNVVLALWEPQTAENSCQHEAVTYQEELLQPQKNKTGSDGLKQCKELLEGRRSLNTRGPAHTRRRLQSHPREMNVQHHPCTHTENT